MLKALKANRFEFMVWKCMNNVIQLTMTNRVAIVWMAEHSYIKGTEIADKRTKQGAINHFYEPTSRKKDGKYFAER